MAEVKCDVVIFKINKKSSRGYYFKEKAVDDFLASDACRKRIEERTAMGISTHFERHPDGVHDKKVPVVDQALINRSFTHYISKFYKKNGYFMAELTIFDPELFSGEAKDKIAFISGLIQSGVKLPTSAGIKAFYNPITKEGEKIYDIIGIDWTMGPDFEDSKVQ
jgi:hypothetical protein